MKIIIFGGDGYLGWPTAMRLAKKTPSICSGQFLQKIEIESNYSTISSSVTSRESRYLEFDFEKIK